MRRLKLVFIDVYFVGVYEITEILVPVCGSSITKTIRNRLVHKHWYHKEVNLIFIRYKLYTTTTTTTTTTTSTTTTVATNIIIIIININNNIIIVII